MTTNSGRVGTPLCPSGFKTAWADKIPAHPTRLALFNPLTKRFIFIVKDNDNP